MTQFFQIHPVTPQHRLLEQAARALQAGGLIVYPTDSSYALGCLSTDKAALDRMRRIRGVERDHEFTLVCRDLSEIANYARVDNWAYRLLRSLTPGPYTFILKATHETPKRLQDPKRRSIGIRVPDNRITLELLAVLGEPIMSSTLILSGEDQPITDPDDVRDRLRGQVDLVLSGGPGGLEPTTVIDLSGGEIRIVRRGKGDVSAFEP